MTNVFGTVDVLRENGRLRVVAYIKLAALESNYALIRSRIPATVKLLCVVKADAYGHGVLPVTRLLERLGADFFGVATLSEGIFLRDQGLSSPILVMGGFLPWEDIEAAAERRLSVVLHDSAALERIGRSRLSGARPLQIHVKVDTGMGRLGFVPAELPAVLRAVKKMEGVSVEGMMSHFAASESRDNYGLVQIDRFRMP